MKTIDEINSEISMLNEKLSRIKGTETEVYTRIVGYYRSIKNWNKGKREEYNFRVPFSLSEDSEKVPAEAMPDTVAYA
jgi:uncharacterized protein YlzI (FlbEa/FlbD family)